MSIVRRITTSVPTSQKNWRDSFWSMASNRRSMVWLIAPNRWSLVSNRRSMVSNRRSKPPVDGLEPLVDGLESAIHRLEALHDRFAQPVDPACVFRHLMLD